MKKGKILSLSLVCAVALSGVTYAFAAGPEKATEKATGEVCDVTELTEVEVGELDQLIDELEKSGADVSVENIQSVEKYSAASAGVGLEEGEVCDVTELTEDEVGELDQLIDELEKSGANVSVEDINVSENTPAVEGENQAK